MVMTCRSERGGRCGDMADAAHETAAIRADGERLAGVFVCLGFAAAGGDCAVRALDAELSRSRTCARVTPRSPLARKP